MRSRKKQRQDSVCLPTIIRVGGRGDQDSPRGPNAKAQEDEQPCGPGRSRHCSTTSPPSVSAPTGPKQCSIPLLCPLSLSPVFSLPYRAMAHGNEKKAAFSAKKNPPFGFSILNFLGVFSCFSAVLGHFKLFTRRC